MITGAQIRAARGLLRWSAEVLAERSRLGVATIRRAEASDGPPNLTAANAATVQATLEAAGVIFIIENGHGPGVRLKRTSVAP
jgi:transcriptional regulator with XRE-family HTH domain